MAIKSKPTVLVAVGILCLAANGLAQTPSADGFNPGADHGVELLVQADQKILIGRLGVTTVVGLWYTNIARLDADGTANDAIPDNPVFHVTRLSTWSAYTR